MRIGFNWWYVVTIVGAFCAYKIGQWRYAEKASRLRKRFGEYIEITFAFLMAIAVGCLILVESGARILQFHVGVNPYSSEGATILTVVAIGAAYGLGLYALSRKGEHTVPQYRIRKAIWRLVKAIRREIERRRELKAEQAALAEHLQRQQSYRVITLKRKLTRDEQLAMMTPEEKTAMFARCQQMLESSLTSLQPEEPEQDTVSARTPVKQRPRSGKTLEELSSTERKIVDEYLESRPDKAAVNCAGVEARFAVSPEGGVTIYCSYPPKEARKEAMAQA